PRRARRRDRQPRRREHGMALRGGDAAGVAPAPPPPFVLGRGRGRCSGLAPPPAVVSWLGGDPSLRARLATAAATSRLLGVERGPGPVHAMMAYARAAGVERGWNELAGAARIAPPDSPRAHALAARLPRPLL